MTALAQFVREYRTVRRAEGWGSVDPEYYRELPFRDLTGRFPEIWRIRARSYAAFVERVLEPMEQSRDGRLSILDLGAGSGWLAYRLAQRGHRVAAIDLLDDALDGLGATRRYASAVLPVIAEFDHLPFVRSGVDLTIFNASFHYSTDYARTLGETLRVLHPGGSLVVLDSPMYRDVSSGRRMVAEREARFARTYGFASTSLASEHFLTPSRLAELASEVGLRWQVHVPSLDWRTRLSRAISGLRAGREPARFPVIVGKRA